MLKHFLVGTLVLSSLALAAPDRFQPVPFPAPRPPSVQPFNPARGDRQEVRRATQLLREYDAALARRDQRAVRAIERDFRAFTQQQLREARFEAQGTRRDERQVMRLTSIARELDRLDGRMNRRSQLVRRDLYVELADLAVRDARRDRRS